jgi:hypothetical protein
MKMTIREFVISEHISLRLEEKESQNGTSKETNIYINDRLFRHCKSLILNIPVGETEHFEEIESIEKVVEKLKSAEKTGWEDVEYDISPEEEFFGHCSNIQAWYESGYDSRFLHYSLSFSLLQELAKHEPYAKTVLKEEIVKRLASGHESVVNYIYESHLVLLLTHGEIVDALLQPEDVDTLSKLELALQQPVYIVSDKFPKYSYNRRDYLITVREKRIVSLRLGGSRLNIIPDIICKLKNITTLYFKDLSNFKYLPDLLKHLYIWQDSDFDGRHFAMEKKR